MNAPELLAILKAAYPDAEITRQFKLAKNTKNILDNFYVDGKLALKGRFGYFDSYHFCNTFRSLAV